MGIKIGRVGLESTAIDVGKKYTQSGNMVSLSGVVEASTTVGNALRQQLLGLVDSPDEPVVPIVFDGDENVNGFWRVRGADVELEGVTASKGMYRWSVSAEKVTGWQAPRIEDRSRGTLRPNSHGVSSTDAQSPSIGIPTAALGWSEFTGLEIERPGRTSTMRVFYHPNSGTLQQYYNDATPSFFLPSTAYYDGAATIKQNGSAVVGRQIRQDSTGWEITNDLVTITPATSTGSGVINVRHYSTKGGQPSTVGFLTALIFGVGSTTGVTTIGKAAHTVTVLRNQPEAVGVRLHFVSTGAGVPDWPLTMDLYLRRGQRWVEGVMSGPPQNFTQDLMIAAFRFGPSSTVTSC